MKKNSIYLQKRDILYLKSVFSTDFVDEEELKKYSLNDFVLIEGADNIKLISSRDEILEFKDFLSMTKNQISQRLDDAEQLLYIVSKKRKSATDILKYNYIYSSAVSEFLEKERNSLSFNVPLTLDMLNSYLFYNANEDYYAGSTTFPHTYEVGRIDGKNLDVYDPKLQKFVAISIAKANNLEKNSKDDTCLTRTESADEKKLYYTINRKK